MDDFFFFDENQLPKSEAAPTEPPQPPPTEEPPLIPPVEILKPDHPSLDDKSSDDTNHEPAPDLPQDDQLFL